MVVFSASALCVLREDIRLQPLPGNGWGRKLGTQNRRGFEFGMRNRGVSDTVIKMAFHFHPLYIVVINPIFALFFSFAEKTVFGSNLEMKSVTREEMGAYMCIARNGVPPATSKIFKLTVNCKYEMNRNLVLKGFDAIRYLSPFLLQLCRK